MTIDHGATAIFHPTATSKGSPSVESPTASSLPIRSAVKLKSDKTDNSFLIEEEKMMSMSHDQGAIEVDEEITSEEDELDSKATERAMLNVALVKSVVETSGNGITRRGSSGSHSYGLRKRRRLPRKDFERIERLQSSKAKGLTRSMKMEDKTLSKSTATPSFVGSCVPSSASLLPSPLHRSSTTPRRQRLSDKSKASFPPIYPANILSAPTVSVPNPLSDNMDSSLTAIFQPAARLHDFFLDPPLALTSSNAMPALMEVSPDASLLRRVDSVKKVTINEPVLMDRKRGLSVDLEFFELGDEATEPSRKINRERTYSFECFAFGINEDELPPLEQSNATISMVNYDVRPRGDSIIFDPASFQDGGIHEQNALQVSDPVSSKTNCVHGEKHLSSSIPPIPSPVLSSLTPVHLYATKKSDEIPNIVVPVVLPSINTASFSLELLNKDGRIGIYLPEARQARISRFLAKRSRRNWRKRIKYDCRKKLADSRPRIKGRFVRRTDVDD